MHALKEYELIMLVNSVKHVNPVPLSVTFFAFKTGRQMLSVKWKNVKFFSALDCAYRSKSMTSYPLPNSFSDSLQRDKPPRLSQIWPSRNYDS